MLVQTQAQVLTALERDHSVANITYRYFIVELFGFFATVLLVFEVLRTEVALARLASHRQQVELVAEFFLTVLAFV